jgi:hypothetical protein
MMMFWGTKTEKEKKKKERNEKNHSKQTNSS